MPLFGLAYIDKDIDFVKKFEYFGLKERFASIFPEAISNDNFVCYYIFKEQWRNLNKIEEIVFGNFKNDFKDKIVKLINILD